MTISPCSLIIDFFLPIPTACSPVAVPPTLIALKKIFKNLKNLKKI
jgi:hypothetical protein